MNGVIVMRALLLAWGPVVELVGDEVYAGDIPAKATLPAIGIREISRVEQGTVTQDAANALITARIQVTVFATDYRGQKELLLATKLGKGMHTGIVDGVHVRSVVRDGAGPDLADQDTGVFQQSRDFKVTYLEPN